MLVDTCSSLGSDLGSDWGALAYPVAALWAFFEGETFVVLAAAAGRVSGILDPWLLVLSVWLGSYAGDQLWFALGRRYGQRAVNRFPGGARKLAAAIRFIDCYGDLFVLSFRFVYGVRNVSSAACGMAGISRLRFAVLNFIAAGVWAAVFVAAGWYSAAWLGPEGTTWLIGIGGLLMLGGLVWHYRRARRGPFPDHPARSF